jgi:hypothetical protein
MVPSGGLYWEGICIGLSVLRQDSGFSLLPSLVVYIGTCSRIFILHYILCIFLHFFLLYMFCFTIFLGFFLKEE